jgi:cell division protein FtsI (penicillin-binding protein 3)
VAFAALAVRVTQLQVVGGDRYRAMALDQRLRDIPLAAERGSVFDRNGRDLAISVEQSSVYADPTLVADPAAYARALAPVVGTDEATLLARLSDRSRRFVYVARTVDDAVAAQVAELALPGVGFVPEPERRYPPGDLVAAVVGRVGGEGYGLDGLEALYEDVLAGTDGVVVVERDQHGREIPDTERRRVEARRGADLVLTIDQAMQYQAMRTLADQVTATGAGGGMAVVLDVRTGDVLAMVTVQGASGGEPARPARAGERNRPLTDLFEPGSTNKVVTVATALEAGVVGPGTTFPVPMTMVVGDEVYEDVHPHGVVQWSVTDIMRESSNVGTIMIAQRLGKERLARALRDFGLGERTAIDFPGQPDGLLLDPDEYYTTGLASTSIGYGVAVTAMQMLDVYATVANGGETRPPRLLHETIDADGTRRRVPSEPGRRVVSAATAATVTEMLTEVVRAGTGACAAVRGYTVAGKTGTARKPRPGGGGYSDETMASFAGFAPAEDPRLAAIVVLDDPGTQYGSRAAAPVFAEIMQWALTRVRVPPTDTGPAPQFDAARLRAASEGNDCAVPHGDALDEVLAARSGAGAGAPVTLGPDDSQSD